MSAIKELLFICHLTLMVNMLILLLQADYIVSEKSILIVLKLAYNNKITNIRVVVKFTHLKD